MYKTLSQCRLFSGLDSLQTEQIISSISFSMRSYSKSDVIAVQGSRLMSMMILTQGSISAETTDMSQRVLNVEHITAPALIAPSFLFAENNTLPVSISAHSEVEMVVVSKDQFAKLLQADVRVLVNFLEIVSGHNTFISEHVVYLTYKTIKGKFANYLLNMMEKHGSPSFRNVMTQREMADMFGVTRPALARAMGELVQDGAIYVKGKQITVLFAEKLMQYAKK